MAVDRQTKAKAIEDIKKDICESTVAVVTDYRGLTVEEITDIRRKLQEKGAEYVVVKNTLAKIAIKDTPFEGLSDFLKGPTAVVLGKQDQVEPVKVIQEYAKKSKKMEIRGGLIDGSALDVEGVKQLADTPSREELYAKMLGSINSPARGIACCVNGVTEQLVRVMEAVRKQKEEAQ